MDDTGGPRDLPVLDAAARMVDERPGVGGTLAHIAADTGLAVEDGYCAPSALSAAGLIDFRQVMGRRGQSSTGSVSGQARQLVGAWPSAESGVDRLLAALTDLEATSVDPDERRDCIRTERVSPAWA